MMKRSTKTSDEDEDLFDEDEEYYEDDYDDLDEDEDLDEDLMKTRRGCGG